MRNLKFIALLGFFSAGCNQGIDPGRNEIAGGQSSREISQRILQQSDQIVSGKLDEYGADVMSYVDDGLKEKMKELKTLASRASASARRAGVSTFDIDTIPSDLILLRTEVPVRQAISQVKSTGEEQRLIVTEAVKGDGRSEGYSGTVTLVYSDIQGTLRLQEVIFKRLRSIPEWTLSEYLTKQLKMVKKVDGLSHTISEQ